MIKIQETQPQSPIRDPHLEHFTCLSNKWLRIMQNFHPHQLDSQLFFLWFKLVATDHFYNNITASALCWTNSGVLTFQIITSPPNLSPPDSHGHSSNSNWAAGSPACSPLMHFAQTAQTCWSQSGFQKGKWACVMASLCRMPLRASHCPWRQQFIVANKNPLGIDLFALLSCQCVMHYPPSYTAWTHAREWWIWDHDSFKCLF